LANLRPEPKWKTRLLLVLFVLLLTIGVGLALSSELLVLRRVAIQEGQAASEDIAAPRRIEFPSEILTERARINALADVREIYDPLDRQVGREQVYLAQQILDFVDSVRADPYASPAYRRFCLGSITEVNLSAGVISDTLQLSEGEWAVVQQETRRVLAQVMREEIKTGQEDLYRRSVRAMIDFDLSEPQTAIVNEIASGLVKVNRPYNQQATEAARQAAIDGVQPQMRVLEQNEIIVRSGEIVTGEHVEALAALGLLHPQVNWLAMSGSFLFVLALAVPTAVYLSHSEPALLRQPHHLLLLLLLLVVFTFLAKAGLGQPISEPYSMPLAALGMLVTVLFNLRLGLVAQALLCLIVGYMAQGRADLFLYTLAGGLVGIYALRHVNRINTFVWAGLYVMGANIAVVLAFTLLGGKWDMLQTGRVALVGLANGGIAAILSLGGYYLLGMAFNITTVLQLLDLARPTHPLMHQLLLKAPGTYHHSIMVGNLAEQAAEAIGADALLARVGAFYHDIGKTVRPYFFVENQMQGSNPHDLLDPETSSHIIRNHTADGLELARRFHLPHAIRAFITEHHGTAKIGYFYHKASKEYGEQNINADDYRHLGPLPQSRESAIVMLADSCEATVRSVHPQSAEALNELVRRVIADKITSHQLDDTPLTLKEIGIIASSFIDTLQGVFHLRISYPDEEPAGAPILESHRVVGALDTPSSGSLLPASMPSNGDEPTTDAPGSPAVDASAADVEGIDVGNALSQPTKRGKGTEGDPGADPVSD